MKTITHFVERIAWGQRERTCRQRGHQWSDRTDPICCGRCGAMRTYGRWW